MVMCGASLCVSAGCMSRQAAVEDRAALAAARPVIEWPERYATPLALSKAHPTGMFVFENASYTLTVNDKPFPLRERGVFGVGAVRSASMWDFVEARPDLAARAKDLGWDGSRDHLRTISDSGVWELITFASYELAPATHGGPSGAAAVKATEFRVYGTGAAPCRGLVVQLGSLVRSSAPEERLSRSLAAAGWMVLATSSPMISEHRTRLAIDRTELTDAAAGARIAAHLDGQIADWAFAVEGVLAYLEETYPELRDRPRVVVGCSLGSFAAPAIAARLDRPPDAAVLVGGGGSFLRVIQTSSIRQNLFTVLWSPEAPSRETAMAIEAGYRDASKLDVLHAAPYLHDIPVLMLHARWDAIVPASTGELLWEALNRPERWVYPDGHLGLFWKLGGQSKRIVDWIDAQVETIGVSVPAAASR